MPENNLEMIFLNKKNSAYALKLKISVTQPFNVSTQNNQSLQKTFMFTSEYFFHLVCCDFPSVFQVKYAES